MAFLGETHCLSGPASPPGQPSDSGAEPIRDRQTVGQGPQTHGATRDPYTWQIGSGSSRLFLQTQDGKITPGKSPSLKFLPPHPTPGPALTGLRRRRAP